MARIILTILFLLYSSIGFCAVEDFTTYTEYDPNTKITVTSTKISSSYGTNEGSVYKSYGSNYFTGNFEHKFTALNSGIRGGTNLGMLWALSDSSQATFSVLGTANKGVAILIGDFGGKKLYLWDFNGDEWDVTTETSLTNDDSLFYVTVSRSSSTITAYFYSDSSRTTLIDSLAVTSSEDFQYINGYANNSLAWYGYTENLDLGGSAPTGRTRRFMVIQ